ncbi:hypothetical protein GM418_01995 [Maribellus comscasis]|uniref:VWA domain-containing protein n=1 Tax=Maribellus comscasis TaxID=2681766 RepID=A0A6I6JQT8_9BACT|nr:hypothetical protein [Maribellus comscasis]QGY42467.1 hypothetical protein GM418_01995 [Maribellus comscasis]
MNIKKSGYYWILLLFTFASCKTEVAKTTDICVLIDVTDEKFRDENFVSESVPKLLKLMKLDKENGGYSGASIKLSLINEISDSKSKTAKIKAGETGMMGENPLNRRDEVVKFCEQFEANFSQILASADWGTNASKIYQKVTRELIKMKNMEGDKKYLVVYSDMLENSDLFSFYGSNWETAINKMIENPEETLDKLGKKGPALPDLSEFIIYIVPHRTPENDQKINLSEQFWTTLFEYRGATVIFNSVLEV